MIHERPSRVLVVDDDPALRTWLQRGLATQSVSVWAAETPEQVLAQVASGKADLVVTDLRMPGMNGIELCGHITRQAPGLPVLVVTAYADYESALGALRAGARDLLPKPLTLERLRLAVTQALSARPPSRERRRSEQPANATKQGVLLGESAPMRALGQLLDRVARTDSSLLITGESGTGKELVARELHARSGSQGRFVAVNCAAIPESLLESELFGYERGAFTGARGARQGLFLEAEGGTLFLDEIGELPIALQAKLLRALQERCVRPLGSRQDVSFRARLVCATNQDLGLAVDAGRFREDLFFRVNVIEATLPPLRQRGHDVLLLAAHFLESSARRLGRPVSGLAPEVTARFLAYAWPGNVRELANVIERAVVLTSHDHVTLADLPPRLTQCIEPPRGSQGESELVTLGEMERRYVLHVLKAVGGSRTAAAKVLGLDRSTLWRRLERYGCS